jgi:hypothetical protein
MRQPNPIFPSLIFLFFACAASGQALQQLPTNYLEPDAMFGYSVSINGNGDYIAVGAPFHRNYQDVNDQKEGVAFMYHLSGTSWILQDTLDNPTLSDMDGLGTAVALNTDGTLCAVGAPGAGNNRGDARLFKRVGSSWSMLAPLAHFGNGGKNTGAKPNDGFGASLSLSGSGYYLAVGSPSHQNGYGRANVCYYDPLLLNWTDYAEISNPDPDKSDHFGSSIAIDVSGNFLVIGAPGEDNGNGPNNNETDRYGAVYFYQRNVNTQNDWDFVQKINPPTLQPLSEFGHSVAFNITADTLIVGAPGHNGIGAAFIYKRTGIVWTLTDEVAPHSPQTGEGFGASVALSGSGDIAMIGSPLRDTASVSDAGSAFLFNYVNPSVKWKQLKNLALPPGYQSGEIFGHAVAIAANQFTAAVGAPFRGGFRGAAFVVLPSALPVTWLSFRATLNGDNVQLSWSTASESNNEGFEVQRSENGRDWQTLAFVQGAGTTSEITNYSHTDHTLSTLHSQLIYYRLLQKDYDGTTDYSPVRVVVIPGSDDGGVKLYPNPASDLLTVSFGEPTAVRGRLQVLSPQGRLIAEHVIAPQTRAYELRVSDLAPGMYMLKIALGAKIWTERLVIE